MSVLAKTSLINTPSKRFNLDEESNHKIESLSSQSFVTNTLEKVFLLIKKSEKQQNSIKKVWDKILDYGDNVNKFGTEIVVKSNEIYKRCDDIYKRGECIYKYGDDIYNRGADIYKRGTDIYKRCDDIYKHGEDIYKHGEDVINRSVDIFKRSDDIYNRGADIYKFGDNIYKRGEDIINRSVDINKRSTEIVKRLEEITKHDYVNKIDESDKASEIDQNAKLEKTIAEHSKKIDNILDFIKNHKCSSDSQKIIVVNLGDSNIPNPLFPIQEKPKNVDEHVKESNHSIKAIFTRYLILKQKQGYQVYR